MAGRTEKMICKVASRYVKGMCKETLFGKSECFSGIEIGSFFNKKV